VILSGALILFLLLAIGVLDIIGSVLAILALRGINSNLFTAVSFYANISLSSSWYQ
jgi:hypothetical protein